MSILCTGSVGSSSVEAMTSASPNAASAGALSAPSLLPPPCASIESSGDVGAEIAGMAVDNGEVERHADDETRAAERQQQETEEASEVQSMRNEASSIRESSVWSCVGGVLQGAGSIAAGAVALNGGGETSADRMRDEHWGALLKGTGDSGSAMAKLMGGMSDAQKASLEADATMHKDAADRASSAADDMKREASTADDTVTAALEFYREYVSTQAQTWNAALHRS